MSGLKQLVDPIRGNRYVSLAARAIARPLKTVCDTVSTEIARKVWINGAVVTYDGITLRFPSNIGRQFAMGIYWNGDSGFDKLNWQVLRALLSKNARHFIDIGSNIGLYSVLAKKLHPDLRVHAFEPVPSIFAKNRRFHQANGLGTDAAGDSTRLLQKAVAASDGTMILYLPVVPSSVEEESTGTLRPDSWQAAKPNAEDAVGTAYKSEIVVDTVSLDSYCRQHAIDGQLVIKIDVEDFEASVFEGGRRVLAEVRPFIVSEMLPRHHGNQQSFRLLESSGYSVFGITDGGIFRCTAPDLLKKRDFGDFLLVPEQALSRVALAGHNYLSMTDLSNLADAVAVNGP